MAKIVEFYIPDGFQKRVNWIRPEQPGQVIEIGPAIKIKHPKLTVELTLDEPAESRPLFNAATKKKQ